MTVSQSAPAVFSYEGTGRGNAVAYNAVTYAGPPFSVTTAENAGADKRTRLAILGTGIRHAGTPANPAVANVASSVRVRATGGGGRAFTLPVEYAGPAPSFPGVDQVNVVLPPDAGTLDRLDITVEAGGRTSNTLALPLLRVLTRFTV
jgi:uncharacterized protein (TIGR03437 family)